MGELICNQKKIPKDVHRYGLRSSAATGCGWIAAYNALVLLGYDTDIGELIRYFEWQLPLIHGNAGTSFWGPALCLKKWGFPVEITADRKRYDAKAAQADVSILFYHWRQGAKLGAHFVALHRTEAGFVGYNTYSNSTGPDHYGPSLEAFIKRQGFFGTVLITAKRKR